MYYKNSLAYKYPKLCKEWDYKKNILTPEKILYNSKKVIMWICANGHSYKMRVYRKTSKYDKCPKCKRINGNYISDSKRLLSEWDYNANKDLCPNNIGLGSARKVAWKCKNGHSFLTSPNNRKNGSNCPSCSGNKVSLKNSLKNKYPKLCKEWDYKKNTIDINNISFGSNKKAWWICPSCHYSYLATVLHRTGGSNCPCCSGRVVIRKTSLGYLYKKILNEWDFSRNKIDPYKISPGSKKKVNWICKKGHRWMAQVSNRTHGNNCPLCKKVILKNGTKCDSKVEAYFYLKLKQKFNIVRHNLKYPSFLNKNIGNRKYDFFIPKINKYIEVTGFNKNSYLSFKDYKEYKRNIEIKKRFVEKVLKAKFEFRQYKLSEKDKKFVERYLK